MDPQEIKEQYQRLLEDYHSKKIDWKTFEMRLLELKLQRSQLPTEPEGPPPQTEKSFFSPPPQGSFSSNMSSAEGFPGGTGRFQLDHLPGNERTGTGIHRTGYMPSEPRQPERTSITARQATAAQGPIRATGPIQSPKRANRLNAGVKLGDDYRLHRFLGVGQFGETWLAEEIHSGNFVVIRPVPQQIQNDDAANKTLQKAYRLVGSLKFPGVCPVFRLAKDEVLGSFTVSAYVDALPLDEYYEHYRRSFHGFPITLIVQLLWPIARALDFAHRRGITHRNLTPNNVLVGKHCGCVMTDFLLPTMLRMELRRLGIEAENEENLHWQAPEVLTDENYSPRSDQYALGVLVYQLIFGHRPFRGRTEQELREEILLGEPPNLKSLPAALAVTLRKVLSKEPEGRFAGCLDFIAQLDKQGSQGTRPETAAVKTASKSRRGLWSVLFGGAAIPMPESVARATVKDLWPFEDSQPQTASEARPKATFPYENPPRGYGKSTSSNLFRASSLAAAGGVTAVVLGGILCFSLFGSPKETTPEQEKAVTAPLEPEAPRGGIVVREETPRGGIVVREEPPSLPEIVHPPTTHQILEANAESVDPREVDRLDKLAVAGDANAQRKLGEAFYYGKGVPRDRKRAAEYFQLGAAYEDVSSTYHLARCYELGLGGIQKSLTRAIKLYKTAAEGGSEPAREALQRLNVHE